MGSTVMGGGVDSTVTGPITGHVNFDLCVRSCPPGFRSPEVLFPCLYSRLYLASPAHTEEKSEEYQSL